jgi:chemotaxis protein methyltransferase CheR
MGLLFDRGPPLGVEQFRLIRDLINEFCGIHFGDEALHVVERRLRDRLGSLGLSDFVQYYQFLRYHPEARAELERAVDELTTNETYFFREEYQLRGFAEEVLPEIRERAHRSGGRRLAIWSAGCSTGEEVYTLAILVAETGLFDGWDVRVFGNDISRRVLAEARRGAYRESSFRAMPRRYEKYFVPGGAERVVHPRIRAMCHFGQMNLLDSARAAIVGRVECIFCRNVLIYFDGESRRRVIQSFYERLTPGGTLFLGHSESLLNASTAFELVHLSTDLVYRRPETPESTRPGATRR